MGRVPPAIAPAPQRRTPGHNHGHNSPSQTRPPRPGPSRGLMPPPNLPPALAHRRHQNAPSTSANARGNPNTSGAGSSGHKRANKKRRNSFKPPLPAVSLSRLAPAAAHTRRNVPPSPVGVRGGRRRSALLPQLPAAGRRMLGASVAAGLNSGAVVQEESGAANIRVAVRVRPENQREIQHGMRNVIEIIDEQMLIFDPKDCGDEFFFKGKLQSRRDLNKRVNRDHKFAFDVVFGPQSTNEEVFDRTTKDLVDVLFNGYNCSVFVYGSTGAGKTHTMLGSPDNPGLTYRTVLELYQRLESVKEEVSTEVAVSYLEIYNETVIDLINPGPQLTIREDGNNGVNIPGLSLHKPEGPEHLLNILQSGNANRTQHPTDANAESSRSHAVFQVYLKQRSRTVDLSTDVKVAKLSMIDLAGSERGTVAMAAGAKRLREGANINRSLLALGNCINSLADGSKYVPFRDSKLTRLLKDSIGGNCRTVMISNVTPNAIQFEDTYNTLKYADRAKKIKIRLRKNVTSVDFHVAQYAKVVESFKTEVESLKSRNALLETENKDLKEKLSSVACSQTSRISTPEPQEDQETRQQLAIHEAIKGEKASHELVVQGLLSQLASKQKDHDALLARLDLLEKGPKQVHAKSEEQIRLEAMVLDSMRLREILDNERQMSKKLRLRVAFAKSILERSQLIAFDDGSNKRITKYIAILEKRLEKKVENEKARLERFLEDRKKLDAILRSMESRGSVGGTSEGVLAWQARFHRVDLKQHQAQHNDAHVKDVLSLLAQETARVDAILCKCLPLLKQKHLMLCSLDQAYAAKGHDEFMDLVASVQCTKVQFNELPGVKSFNPADPAKDDEVPATGRLLSICGVDSHLAAIFSNDVDDDGEDSDCVMEWSNVGQTQDSVPAALDSTFSLTDAPSSQVDSTFVVQEEEEDDVFEVIADNSPKVAWRPATPPKKSAQSRLSKEKENGTPPVVPKMKALLKSGSQSKVPLKPSNN